MGRRVHVTAQQVAAEYRAGASINDLIRRHGVSRKAIEARLNAAGVQRRGQAEATRLHHRGSAVELGEAAVAKLRALQAEAVTVRGPTPQGHPARLASEELTALLAGYMARGMSAAYLGEVLGVKGQTVLARLARHGYRPLPPSQR